MQLTSFAFPFFDKSQLLSLGKIPRSMFNYKVFVSIRQICKRENVKYAKEKISTATFDSESFVQFSQEKKYFLLTNIRFAVNFKVENW